MSIIKMIVVSTATLVTKDSTSSEAVILSGLLAFMISPKSVTQLRV